MSSAEILHLTTARQAIAEAVAKLQSAQYSLAQEPPMTDYHYRIETEINRLQKISLQLGREMLFLED
jgi:hypothetical protein